MFKLHRPRGALAALALGAAAAALAAATALAAQPIKGATYSGLITRVVRVSGVKHTSTLTISFKVSPTGKSVSAFTLTQGYPIYCQGGGFGSPQPASGKVSKQGTFKVSLPLYFAPNHSHQGKLVVTGKFGRGGAESGKVTTAFTAAKSCNGSSNYRTTG